MSSSDDSFGSSSDSETAQMEIEYDLEVKVMSNANEQKDTLDDDEPEDVFVNEPLADYNWLAQYEAEREKRTRTRRETMPWICHFPCLACCCMNNAFIWDFLSFYGSKDCPKPVSDQWPGMTSQTALYPDYFK